MLLAQKHVDLAENLMLLDENLGLLARKPEILAGNLRLPTWNRPLPGIADTGRSS